MPEQAIALLLFAALYVVGYALLKHREANTYRELYHETAAELEKTAKPDNESDD